MARALRRLLLLLTGVVLALATGELALRIAGFSWHLAPEKVLFGWPQSLATLESRYRPDGVLMWVRADQQAAISAARRGGQPLDVAFLGDSCTEFSDYPERLIELLADRLPDRARAGRPLRGLPLGTAGWTTFQGRRRLERDVLPLRPRIVTVYFGWNDHWLALGPEDAALAPLLRVASSPWDRLRLVQLGERSYMARFQGASRGNRVPLPAFRDNLTAMAQAAAREGSRLMLITAPSLHVRGEEPEYLRGRFLADLDQLVPVHQAYVQAVRDVASEQNTLLCDLASDADALPREPAATFFKQDGIHLTALGDRWVSRSLLACFARSGALDALR